MNINKEINKMKPKLATTTRNKVKGVREAGVTARIAGVAIRRERNKDNE